jgi:hypothetical protein
VKLIPLDKLSAEAPHWPWSSWATARLIRKGELGAVKVGRRVFVTRELLDAFIASHIVAGNAGPAA